MITEISYNGNYYNFLNNDSEPSVKGCIEEIIKNNTYNLEKFVNIDTAIIDIGANCGIASIILAKQNPLSKIYSFEPDINVYKMLLFNIKLNDVNNVIPHNIAVSCISDRILELKLCPLYSGGNTTCSYNNDIDTYFGSNVKSVNVLTKSLDDIIIQNNIDNIELLKIDCEGAEYEILYNSNKFKMGIVKNLVGEFHDLQYNIDTTKKPYELFEYSKKYVKGFKKITILEIKNNFIKENLICDEGCS